MIDENASQQSSAAAQRGEHVDAFRSYVQDRAQDSAI